MPDQTQEPESPECPPDHRAGKRKIIYWLIVAVVGNGIFDVFIDMPVRDLDFMIFVTTGLAAFFAFAWVRLDAKEHGLNLKTWGAPIALLTKFTLPFYFIVSRGWKNGLIANLWTAFLLLALLVIYSVTIELTLYLRELL